jgi:hypothetical protein
VSISGHSPEELYLIINDLRFWHWICVFPSERTKQNSHLANTEQKTEKSAIQNRKKAEKPEKRPESPKKDRKVRKQTGKPEKASKPEDPGKRASRKTRIIKIKQQAI